MLPRNIEGEIPSLEDSFHSLHTRLYMLKQGLFYDWNNNFISDKKDVNHKYKRNIQPIEENIFGYPPKECIDQINYFLNEISEIESKREILFTDPYRGDTRDYSEFGRNYEISIDELNSDLNEELTYYKEKLNFLCDELNKKLSSSSSGNAKLKVNLNVHELAYLIRLLHYDFKNNLKVFGDTAKTEIFNKIVNSFSTKQKENNSPKSLMNKYNKLDTEVIDFWINRLNNMLKQAEAEKEEASK